MKTEDKPLILVIDDIPDNLQVVYHNLDRIGYEVSIADRGVKGLERARAIQPDLILLDIMMPGMDGFEVCRHLKQSPETAMIPVIFLTAKDQNDDIVEAFKCGGVDYIIKPFNVMELIARVKTHVALKRSREALMQANASKDRFFSIISHDTKAVLSGVISLAEMTLQTMRQASKEEIQEDLDSILGTSKKLYDMLENLLDWATVQNGTMAFRPDTVSLSEIAEMVYDLFQSKCVSKKLTIENQIEEGTIAFADHDMALTILRNLVSNAVKFSNEGGIVTISAERSGDYVEVAVTDRGVGIPPEAMDKLFNIEESFSTEGTSKESGSGLGLVLCRDLVLRNNGDIKVKSTLGEGTMFAFTLPVEASVKAVS